MNWFTQTSAIRKRGIGIKQVSYRQVFTTMKIITSMMLVVLSGLTAFQRCEAQATANIDQRLDSLMKLMTLEEKIGQLNLPSAGDFTTGAAESSDIAKKIMEGKVGGLFNIKTVAKIRAMQ